MVLMLSVSNIQYAQERTCCVRDIGVGLDIPMPQGQQHSQEMFIWAGFLSPVIKSYFSTQTEPILHENGAVIGHRDLNCEPPIDVFFIDSKAVERLNKLVDEIAKLSDEDYVAEVMKEGMVEGADYIFRPTLEVLNPELDALNGDIMGEWILTMDLYDPHHRELVRSAQTSWMVDNDGDQSAKNQKKSLKGLADHFNPIQRTLYDYERPPLSVKITTEEEEIESGEKMMIYLDDIFHVNNTLPQGWQYLAIKLSHGELLNLAPSPCSEEPRTWVVPIEALEPLVYKAPEGCKNEKVTIEVYNTCKFTLGQKPCSKELIGTGEFEVICSDANLNIKYEGNVPGPMVLRINYDADIPLKVDKNKDVTGEGIANVNMSILGGELIYNIIGTESWYIEGELVKQEEGPTIFKHSGEKRGADWEISGGFRSITYEGTLKADAAGNVVEKMVLCEDGDCIEVQIPAFIPFQPVEFPYSTSINWEEGATKRITGNQDGMSWVVDLTLTFEKNDTEKRMYSILSSIPTFPFFFFGFLS